MKIKDLKDKIKNLDDNVRVVVLNAGFEENIEIETIDNVLYIEIIYDYEEME
jgi:hypothetical protein|tara:strand:- start:593 stop:748 length:156 start_codon:yes stop_codon:yes gene_type:complete